MAIHQILYSEIIKMIDSPNQYLNDIELVLYPEFF